MNIHPKHQYRLKKQKQLSKEISKYKKIYFDINYWIWIRDAHVKRTDDTIIVNLYEIITELVKSNKVICPVSPIVFDEILKQSGEPEFFETIKIIELLSQNVLTITEQEVVSLQFRSIFDSYLKQNSRSEIEDFVWTKAIDAFGHQIPPTPIGFENQDYDIAQYTKYLDDSWEKSLYDMMSKSEIGLNRSSNDYKKTDIISALNNNNEMYKHEFSSFEGLLKIERLGMLDAYKCLAWQAFEDALSNIDNDYSEKTKIRIFKILMNKVVETKNQVPAIIEIPAGIHSIIRYENREYQEFNDFFDYHHCYSAIPFFDFFFTERKLSNLVNHKRLQFGIQYNCQIEYKIKKALNLLNKLL